MLQQNAMLGSNLYFSSLLWFEEEFVLYWELQQLISNVRVDD